jgi:hypothetical protein
MVVVLRVEVGKIYKHFLKAYRKRFSFLWCLLFGMGLGQRGRLQWAIAGSWKSWISVTSSWGEEKRILGPLPLFSRWEIREMRVIHDQLDRLSFFFLHWEVYLKIENLSVHYHR